MIAVNALDASSGADAPIQSGLAAPPPAVYLRLRELGLPPVTFRKLAHRGVRTIGDLTQWTPERLLQIRSFVSGRVDGIVAKLARVGLRLAGDDGPEWIKPEGGWVKPRRPPRPGRLPPPEPPPPLPPQPIPAEQLLDITALPLSVRAKNALHRAGFQRVHEVIEAWPGGLMKIRALGRKSRAEIGVQVERLKKGGIAPEAGLSAPVGADLEAFIALHAATLDGMRERLMLTDGPIDSSDGVEAELESALLRIVKPKSVSWVNAWVGLAGHAPASYAHVADRFGVSRERPRQVLHEAEVAMKRARLALPRLREALALLAEVAPLPVDDAARRLRERGLTRTTMHISSLLRVAELFGIEHGLFVRKQKGLALVVRDGVPPEHDPIVRMARHLVRVSGYASVADVVGSLERIGTTLDPALAERKLRSLPDFCALGGDISSLFRLADSRNPIREILRRMLAVAGRVRLGQLRVGLERAYPERAASLPTDDVLRAFCQSLSGCDMDEADWITSRRPVDPAVVLDPEEKSLLELLTERGPAVQRAEMRLHLIGLGYSANWLAKNLHRSPTLSRVAIGRYSLFHHAAEATDLERAQPSEGDPQGPAVPARRDSGILKDWGAPDGESLLWAIYHLRDRSLHNDIPVHLALCEYLPDGATFNVTVEGEHHSATGRIDVRGGRLVGLRRMLLPLFEMGARHVSVSFALEEGIAHVEARREPFEMGG